MAVSLDLVLGLNQAVLFAPFFSTAAADLIGSAFLFFFSLAFMTGIALRLNSLALILFIFCSSLIETFLRNGGQDVSGFWRDLALVCAILSTYSNFGKREIRYAMIKARRLGHPRKVRNLAHIIPKRIEQKRAQVRPIQHEIRAALQAVPIPNDDEYTYHKPRTAADNVENIFAEAQN